MKKNLVILLLAITCQIFAQTNLITGINISLPANPDANIAEWAKAMPPLMISAQTRMENGRVSPMVMESSILVSIKGNGAVCGSYTKANAPASNFNSPAKVWSGETALNLLGKTCVLKPGIYEFCVQFYGEGAVGQVLFGEGCKSFTIKETEQLTYQPPQLLAPANGTELSESDLKKPMTFRWTPVIPKPQELLTYRLTVWQLMQGQTGVQAMRVNQPIITKDVDNITQALVNNIIDGPCKPPLICAFVWNVQALNREGKPIGRNNGTSEVFILTIPLTAPMISGKEVEIKLVSPRGGEKIAEANPTFVWQTVDVVSPTGGEPQSYKIKIVEIIGNQSPEVALRTNKPFFEKEEINGTSLIYPISAKKLNEGKKYAWMIQCGELRSSISIFDRWGIKIAYSWETDYRLDNADILGYLQTDEVIIKKGEYLFDYSTNPNGDVILPLAKPIRDNRRNKADVMFEGVPANIDCKLDGSSCVGGPRSTVGKPSFYTVKPLLANGFIIQLILSYKGANISLVGNQSNTKTSDACKYLSVNFMEERKVYKGDSIGNEVSIINKYSGSELKNKPTSFRINIRNNSVIGIDSRASKEWTRTPSKFPPGSSQIKWTNNSGDIPQGETKLGTLYFAVPTSNPYYVVYDWLNKEGEILCKDSIALVDNRFYYNLDKEPSYTFNEISNSILRVQFSNPYASVENIQLTVYDVEANKIKRKSKDVIKLNSVIGLNRISIDIKDYNLEPGRLYLLTISDFHNTFHFKFKVTNDREK